MAKDFNTSELVDIIASAGLIEDFIKWYRERFDSMEVPSTKSLPPYILIEYAKLRKLIPSNDPIEENLKNSDDIIKYEPLEVKPRITPKNRKY
ncbi:MAG: hypothetical protein F7B60_07535 [Desulfurococcales archaeon]|nr:hypothetical protein [Desulfurococcales archaeon]